MMELFALILVEIQLKLLCIWKITLFLLKIFLAGNNVTADLSHGLQISEETAELTKIMYGSIVSPFNENIEINLDSKKKNSKQKSDIWCY